ncbi:MAG TPA: tetratricopeptide repeat protein [Methylomusa anaerophila]|uniref:TPR repeat-containing protein YrrB n=1 Tax=Methylomusa anaerophila TaxID=1930071 RepID=A0A348AL94_9FIRM|nr:tetratricopeptide repeat protein [Methylomusa anaerophila]BBB91842.1 TPR repeat-containing protein YrrB [Methylomusa anaerophila]HML88425.1 tetratricopeptide repeat protein [Methylomusa anaerophila]
MKKYTVVLIAALLMISVASAWAADSKAAAENKQKRITAYTRAITANPQDAAAYIDRGDAYRSDNQLDLAIADYTQAIKLEPQNVQAYAARGLLYLETKQYDAALADYSSIIEMDPGNMDARFRRGVCYYYKGQYELGIHDLDQVTVLQPKHAGAYLVKGVCYQRLERKEEAIAAYKSLLANVPVDKQTQEAVTVAKNMLKTLGAEP